MDEFLEKLAEDQRRMRKFLRTQGVRFKKMGEALARTRDRGSRIFVIGEPPLDHLAEIVSVEYLQGLPAVCLRLDEREGTAAPEPSGEVDPTGSSGQGPPLVARHLSRHFRSEDVLLVIAHRGAHPAIKALLGFATLRGTYAVLVGGLDARASLRKAANTAITLPTRGVKTVCESTFVVARILARVARSLRAGPEEDKLVRHECPSCHEPVFVDERRKARKCPLCRASLRAGAAALGPASDRLVVAEAAQEEPPRSRGSSRRRPKRPLKQSVLNVPTAAVAEAVGPEDDDEAPEAPPETKARASERVSEVGSEVLTGPVSSRRGSPPEESVEGAAIVGAAGETTSAPDEAPPVGLSSRDDPDETVIAPEDVAFDEFANATESADPFALPDAFVGDLVMPQGRPSAAGAPPPSDVNPLTSDDGSARAPRPHGSSDDATSQSARLVSARFSVNDCKLRFGIGAFPEDDSGPEHPLESISTRTGAFTLDPQDEMGSTVDAGDELWIRISVPAFLEPVLVRGVVVRIGGNSDGAHAGTRVELEWKDPDANVTRKLARAAETLGAGAK